MPKKSKAPSKSKASPRTLAGHPNKIRRVDREKDLLFPRPAKGPPRVPPTYQCHLCRPAPTILRQREFAFPRAWHFPYTALLGTPGLWRVAVDVPLGCGIGVKGLP